MKTEEKEKKLNSLEVKLKNLKQSPLYEERVRNDYQYVFGEGNIDSQIMLVGEAPGKNESLSGKPFCGSSGKVLDELFNHIGIERKNVYITNIVKDRPPENRDPTSKEIEVYTPLLEAQIEIIRPKVIAPLGRHSLNYILKKYFKKEDHGTVTNLHGKKFFITLSYGEVVIVPLYHPAVALYNVNRKDVLKKDFEILKSFN